MKKAYISLVLFLLMGAVLALCSFNITVQAAGTQQTEEYVSVDLIAYFDPENIIETYIPIPVEDDMWFDEATNKLYTFGASDWDAGDILPIEQPGSPVNGDQWFDEATDKLYTYTTGWDAGVELPVADPGLTYGQTLSFASDIGTMSGHTFLYWEVNESINYYPVDHQFSLADTNELKAVFSPSDKHVVTFVDSNSKILKIEYVVNGGTATAPETLPTKLGYNVAETNWNTALTNITTDTIAVLQYTKTDTTSYSLSVTNGTGDGSYEYNTVATVLADAPEGEEIFHHWEVDGRIVSYKSTYKFTVFETMTISAVYDAVAPSDLPYVTLHDDIAIRGGYKTFIGQFYLPTGYTLVEYGMIGSTSVVYLDLGTSSTTRYQGNKYNGTTNEFVMSFETAYVTDLRAYVVCRDPESNLETYYSGQYGTYNVLNGGFETGNLNGWNSLSLWKGESGMTVYVNDLVVSGTYFSGNYPYDRDETYNIGVEGGSVVWSQSSERMGYLRSSDFILGGSGWISFKLGGGKTTSTAYVSIKRSSDNVEIARFGNRHFNDTVVASTQYESSISNAEAFLFQYYFDLSSVGTLGESYYILLNDTSANDWCILSADTFVTYYMIAPSTTSDTLAENIVPTINLQGSATASIVNGYFNDGLNNWDNPNGIFKMDSGMAKSDNGGDAAMGVLRSSAFIVDSTYHYLKFGWGGGMDYDKQIFLSIREVGTNIEVMRIVPREELSNGEGYDNHMVDLSSLDTSKEYYLEYVDNTTGGYGWCKIDEIHLIDSTDWHLVIDPHPGDEATYISGLPTSYTFIYPIV